MTNFAVQTTLGAAAPLVSKNKGSLGNRMDCAGEHIKNTATATVQSAAVGVVACGAARAVANNMSGLYGAGPAYWITKNLSKGFDAAMNVVGKIIKKPDFAAKTTAGIEGFLAKFAPTSTNGAAVKTISKAPGVKALAVIASIALPVLAYIKHNHSYKAGQIDQKYTDKAQLQKTL